MRFCEYCGAPLEDGQQCTCLQAQAQRQQEQPTPPQSQPEQPTPQGEQPGYSYGQAQEGQSGAQAQQPGDSAQQAGPETQQQAGYGYQPGPDAQQQNSYGYQQPGPGAQQQSGYGYQQPGGYNYQQPGPNGQPQGGYGYQQPGPGQQQGYGYQQQPGGYGGYQGQPGGQSAQQAQQQFAQMGRQARDTTVRAAKSLKPFFAQYWTSPVQAVRTAVAEKNLILAVTLTVIRVVVVIALLWSMVGKVAGVLRSSFGALSSLSSMFGSGSAMSVSGNPLGSIGFGLIIAVLGMALFTLVLFVLTRIFKSGGSILDMYIANSANGGVTTAVLLLAFLCSLFSMGLALGLVVLACFTAVLFGGLSARAVCGDQDSGLFWLCYLVGVLVVLLVSWWLVPACVVQAMGGITLSMNGESVTIGQIIKQLEDVGLSNILSGLFSNMMY